MREDVREYKSLIEQVGENYLIDVSIGKEAGACFIESNKTHTRAPISPEEYEFLRSSNVIKVIPS